MLHEHAFRAMGTDVRLLATDATRLPGARAELARLAARLTRFDPASELSRLNADPRATVPASEPLRAAVAAALAGARATGGRADPTLLGAIERAGYERSLDGRPRADLTAALAAAPARRPVTPGTSWRAVRVDHAAGTITRPPGVRLDLGGSAKGLIADRLAARLAPGGPCVVDCGGDVRVAGRHTVHVLHPFDGAAVHALRVVDAAVATSGIGARIWWRPDGSPAHHLLDPATGAPAWTGVLAATALAPTAGAAEALAKAAVLGGPEAGRRLLRRHGGVLIRDDGEVEAIGAAARSTAVVPLGALRAA